MRDAELKGLYIQIGHRPMGLRQRLKGFLRALFAGLVSPASHVYLPRSATKDAWLIYRLFRRRTTLVSDGISDCLDFVPVFTLGRIRLGFAERVAERFHVLSIRHPVRDIRFASGADIAVFTKRGRDVDYVTAAVGRLCPSSTCVVNAQSGGFSRVFMPASTLVFELAEFRKDRLHIVACDFADNRFPEDRRVLLNAYEAFLEEQGYSVLRESRFQALDFEFKAAGRSTRTPSTHAQPSDPA
jgi:hypothetical protein